MKAGLSNLVKCMTAALLWHFCQRPCTPHSGLLPPGFATSFGAFAKHSASPWVSALLVQTFSSCPHITTRFLHGFGHSVCQFQFSNLTRFLACKLTLRTLALAAGLPFVKVFPFLPMSIELVIPHYLIQKVPANTNLSERLELWLELMVGGCLIWGRWSNLPHEVRLAP